MAAMPPVPFKVKALAPYTPTSATELPLVVGQIYEVTQTDGKGIWVQSQVNGVIGWFPFNYTEVIPSGPPAAAPPIAQSPRADLNSSGGKSKDKGSSTALKKKPKKEKRNVPKKPGPPLRTHVEKNKKNCPVTVTIQVVRAKLAVPDAELTKCDPSAFLFTRDILGDEEGNKFESTLQMKKTAEPSWNESFKLVVEDPERMCIVVRVVNGKEYNKKKSLGEFQIILRGSHRGEYEGEGSYKWHYLVKDAIRDTPKKEGAPGKVLIFVQYHDTREIGKATDFKHTSHIGWSASGGFDLNNIPQEWKDQFREIGLTKAALQSDPTLANHVFSIMEKDTNARMSMAPGALGAGGVPASGFGSSPAPPPPPPVRTNSVSGGPPRGPLPTPGAGSYSAPAQDQYQEEYQEEAPAENSFLASIRKGTSLRSVEIQERPTFTEEPADDGLGGLLKKAMAGRFVAAGGDDDWSEEEPDDDDWD